MKKKTFIVQLLDSKKPSRKSFTQVEDANFYSNDTDASLVFIPHEDTFDFQSAKVVMYNHGDESLVERDMQVTTEDGRKVASYELPDEIISHWGEWVAQPVFISGGEIYSGSIVLFSVFRHLMQDRPPTLRDIIKVDELYSQLVAVMDEISGKDVISAPEIILARGEHETLGERLDKEHNEVTAQLAEIETGNSLSEIVEARGGENTLGERLDKEHNEVASQLAQKVTKNRGEITKSDLSQEVKEMMTGGDSSVEVEQARVDASGNTNATLKERLDKDYNEVTSQLAHIDQAKIGGGKLATLDDLDSDIISAIEGGEGTSFDLLSIPKDRSVTPEKTTFLSVLSGSIDYKIANNFTISAEPSVGSFYYESSFGNAELAYIEVKNGGTYTIKASGKNGSSYMFFVAFTNEMANNAPIVRVHDNTSLTYNETTVTVTNSSDHKYMAIRVSGGQDYTLGNVEIYEGDSISEGVSTIMINNEEMATRRHLNELADTSFKLEDGSITPEKTNFLKIEGGTLDLKKKTGLIISGAVEVKELYWEPGLDHAELAYVEIEDGETYTVKASGNNKEGFEFYVAFANEIERKAPIKRVYDQNFLTYKETTVTVKNDDNYKYMIIRVDSGNDFILRNVEVSKGEVFDPNIKIKINDVKLATEHDLNEIEALGSLDAKHTEYLITEHIENYTVDNPDDVYNLYDSLIEEHEEYRTYRITKNLLGQDDFGNNIYEYVFSRDTLDNHYDIRRKRIGITTTTHGFEVNTTIGLFEFMKELVINKDKNEVFNQIIGNVDIHIIPVLNPSGLTLWTYHNANDVDLFANYDVNWESLPHPNKGSSPASEPETQIAQNWMQQNMFDVYFDYHRSDPTLDNNHFTWLSTDSEGQIKEDYVKTIGLLSLIKAQQYEEFPPYETFGVVKEYNPDGKSYSYATSLGGEGALLEVSGSWRYFPTDDERGSLMVDWSKEVVGNMIMTVSRRWI